MLKTGLKRMQEILDKLDNSEVKMSELLFHSATDERQAKSPNKMTHQKNKAVYLSRTSKRQIGQQNHLEEVWKYKGGS